MGIVEAFLVFSVASFNLTVVTGRLGADLLVLDVQQAQSFFEFGQVSGFVITEAIGEFEAVVGLNTFHFDAFSLELIDNPKQELVGRISGLFRVSTKDSVSGVFINGSVLEQSKLGVSNTFAWNDFYIDLDPFSGMCHLLIRFGLVRIFLFDCYEPFAFQNPPEGFNASGVSPCS